MKKFLTICAWIVSVVFHPLGMTVLGCVLLSFSLYSSLLGVQETLSSMLFLTQTLPIFVLFYVLPLLICGLYFLFFMRTNPYDKHHRLMLLSIVLGIYSVSLFNNSLGMYYTPYLLGCTFVILIAEIITAFWRISLHTIGMGGLLGFFLEMMLHMQGTTIFTILFPFLVIAAGLVGSARLYLQAHTPAQVYVGYVVGFLATGGVAMLLG